MGYNNKFALEQLKNMFQMPRQKLPTPSSIRKGISSTGFNKSAGGSLDPVKNIGNTAIPVPPTREVEDITGWREGVMEMERIYFPYRVKVQQIFRDTILNTQVRACCDTRKNLTLLRNYGIFDKDGKQNKDFDSLFHSSWFRNFLNYSIEAIFYGYSLISLGDLLEVNGIKCFPELTLLRRDNTVPDREIPYWSQAPYMPDGPSWTEEPYKDWHIFISTPSEHGTTSTGFGLFYTIANIEINMRNLLGFNMQYLQMFGSPLRVVNMPDVNNEIERASLEASLRLAGSNNYLILDKDADIKYEGVTVGSGYKSYADADLRFEKKISKVLLGHEDAISSTPGKLGGGQGGSKKADGAQSPVKQALDNIQQSDANFLTPIINNELIPKLRLHGISIPEGYTFKFLNSDEEAELLSRQADLGLKLAQQANFLIGTGFEMDSDNYSELSGYKINKVSVPIKDK